MFKDKKEKKKAVVHYHHEEVGFSERSTTIPLQEGKLLNHLRHLIERDGRLVIESISEDNEITLTTTKTIAFDKTEQKFNNLKRVIEEYFHKDESQ